MATIGKLSLPPTAGWMPVEARETHWERLLGQMLAYHGKGRADIAAEAQSTPWKVMIAHYLKRHTTVTNGWLGQRLSMGVIHGVSHHVTAIERANKHRQQTYERVTAKIET